MSQSIYTSSYTSVTPSQSNYHSTIQRPATTLYQSSNVALHSIGGSASYTPIPTSGVAHSTSSAPSATAFSAAYSIHNAPQTTRPNHSTFSSSASTISGGVTTYETQQRLTGIRRAIIEPDDPTLRPGYDPEDPFYTPVGDTLFPLLLCAVCYILIRLKKTKNQ